MPVSKFAESTSLTVVVAVTTMAGLFSVYASAPASMFASAGASLLAAIVIDTVAWLESMKPSLAV